MRPLTREAILTHHPCNRLMVDMRGTESQGHVPNSSFPGLRKIQKVFTFHNHNLSLFVQFTTLYSSKRLHYHTTHYFHLIIDITMGCGASKNVESQTDSPLNQQPARPSLARQATKSANEDPKSLQFLNAAKDGNFGTLKAFASIVDLNVKDNSGDFALIWACRNGNVDMVDYLITKRNKGMKWTDVDQKNNSGRTPLHEASDAGHANIVSMLLEHNANPDAKDAKGKTPKDLAKNAETAAAFEENAKKQESIPPESEKGTSEVEESGGEELTEKEKRDFFEAAMYGDMDKIKAYVVIRNVDVNIVDPADWTAIMAASQRGNEDVVKYLLANGAKVDMVNNSHATALHYADNGTIAKLLIDHGAPVSVQNEFGESALHTACNAHFVSPGILSVVDLLIENRADCNLRNNEGQTSLHIAVRQEHKPLVEKLVKGGADASIKDNKGQTPMDLATTDDIRYLM